MDELVEFSIKQRIYNTKLYHIKNSINTIKNKLYEEYKQKGKYNDIGDITGNCMLYPGAGRDCYITELFPHTNEFIMIDIQLDNYETAKLLKEMEKCKFELDSVISFKLFENKCQLAIFKDSYGRIVKYYSGVDYNKLVMNKPDDNDIIIQLYEDLQKCDCLLYKGFEIIDNDMNYVNKPINIILTNNTVYEVEDGFTKTLLSKPELINKVIIIDLLDDIKESVYIPYLIWQLSVIDKLEVALELLEEYVYDYEYPETKKWIADCL